MTVSVGSATSLARHSRVVGSARILGPMAHGSVASVLGECVHPCFPTPWTDLAGDAAARFERPIAGGHAERLVPVAARFT
jgi:hypothetical protein